MERELVNEILKHEKAPTARVAKIYTGDSPADFSWAAQVCASNKVLRHSWCGTEAEASALVARHNGGERSAIRLRDAKVAA